MKYILLCLLLVATVISCSNDQQYKTYNSDIDPVVKTFMQGREVWNSSVQTFTALDWSTASNPEIDQSLLDLHEAALLLEMSSRDTVAGLEQITIPEGCDEGHAMFVRAASTLAEAAVKYQQWSKLMLDIDAADPKAIIDQADDLRETSENLRDQAGDKLIKCAGHVVKPPPGYDP